MSVPLAVPSLLRSPAGAVLPSPASARSPTTPHVWSAMLDEVRMRLRAEPERAADCADALDSLHGVLVTERAAMGEQARRLAATQLQLAATRAALAASRLRERQATHLARHDSLTALPNRTSFSGRLDAALGQAARDGAVAVLVLDLDGFKPVNDEYGHHTGDELLKVVAARLARTVRRSDWVARLGGDEFGCGLTGAPGRDRLGQLAGCLYDAIAAPIALGPLRLRVCPSIGIAVHDGGDDGDALIRRADAAMFVAKRSRSRHAFWGDSASP